MAGGGGAPKVQTAAVSPPLNMADPEATINPTEAIYVRGAEKSYGVGKRRSMVLRGLDMNVKKGVIYGLLGASGCGKTTLLSCLVGRRSFDAGEVLVFGGEPGSAESGIPGPRVGYMPQELALYGEFTIGETLEYFGRIYKLKRSFVRSQMDFLFKLLDLPPRHRIVKTLSGGQQRRVSFATALFHDPELLILDEPTVGVDPLLRQNIWDHLVRLSNEHGKTIIITTHYIEEARQAHTIGLMRSGRLLAEESPQTLLRLHGLVSLEDVFLKLCMKDRVGEPRAIEPTIHTISDGKPYANQGVDNPAFSHGCKKSPSAAVSVDDIDKEDTGAQKQLSPLDIAANPMGCQYWKNNKSILPAEEDGIVGLTFSPSGENLSQVGLQANHIDEMNALNHRHHHRSDAVDGAAADSAASALASESKDSLYNAQSSGASSYVGDSNSSCGASTNASVHVSKKRRSRTMALSLPSAHRTSALIRKNFMQTFRNIGLFLFIFLLPVFQAILFCVAIGRDPSFLKIGVVNDELLMSDVKVCKYETGCKYEQFSCRFLRHLSNETFVQVHFNTLDDAIDATRRGDIWGVVHFPQNFTDEFVVRQTDGKESDNATIIGSQIGVNLDWSNQQIALTLQRRLLDAFESFSKDVLKACDLEEAAASIPLTFMDPVYGNKDPSFTEFMAPGIILTLVYFIAVALTAAVFIGERKQGLLDRSLVAGVNMTEILFAHLVNQFTILVGQTGLVFLFMLLVFKIPCHGSIVAAIALTLLQGLCGMCYGLLVSSLCDEETSAIHLALGSFYPNLLISGVMWPMEGMPVFLRYFSYILPQTYAVESLRNIFARGWGIERPEVYWGFTISFFWIAFLVFLSVVVVRIRKYTG